MTVIVRHKRTGETLDVFDFTPDGYLFAGPPGDIALARLVPEGEVEPDSWDYVRKHGFTPAEA